MVGQKFVALCVWVRFPSFNQNTRMAELAYATVLETEIYRFDSYYGYIIW